MKVTISRRELAVALAAVSPAIPTRPAVPILTSVVLTVEGSTLRILATDFELTIERTLDIDPGEDGTVLVSGLRLRDLVSKFTSPTVSIDDSDGLRITSGRSSYRLATMPAGEYPATPEFPAKTGETTADALAFASRSTAHAAKGDTTPLRGLIFEVDDNRLWVATTDAFRAASQPIIYRGDPFRFRITTEALQAAVKNLDGDVDLHVNDSVVGFRTPDASVTVRLIDGEGVNWKAFQKNDGPHVFEFDAAELGSALDRLSLVLERDKAAVVINISNGVAALTTTDPSADGAEEVDVVGDDTAPEFGMKPSYIREFLSCIDGDRIQIAANDNPHKPYRFRVLNTDGEPTDALHVLMPLKLGANR